MLKTINNHLVNGPSGVKTSAIKPPTAPIEPKVVADFFISSWRILCY